MLALINTPQGDEPAGLREVGEPDPAPGEAVVEVRAFALNRGELSLLANRPEGWRPGQDISGVVAEEAADGSGPAAGTRVVGLVDEAGWAQRVAAPAERLAALPDGVGFEEAAALPIAGLTALRTLRLGGPLLGGRVLVTGASGGVGRFAVQLASEAGAYVAGVVGGSRRGGDLAGLGADEVVSDIEEASGRYDLVLESVGGGSLAAAIRLVAPGGTVVVFGNSSGEETPVSFYDFPGREGARIQTFFSYASGTPESVGEDLGLLAGLVGSGRLAPQVGSRAGWRELSGAVAELRERRVPGKAILRVD